LSVVVLDASVAAKWFLPPEHEGLVPEALSLYDAFKRNLVEIVVPDLFWAEFGNLAWKAAYRQRWPEADALHAIRQIRILDFTTVRSTDLLEAAFAISAAHKRSFYDALYVALAHIRSVQMVTADERLANALGTRFPVRWLGSFQM